jgi:hypothetical protein
MADAIALGGLANIMGGYDRWVQRNGELGRRIGRAVTAFFVRTIGLACYDDEGGGEPT